MSRLRRIAATFTILGAAAWIAVAHAGPITDAGAPAEMIGYIDVPTTEGQTIGEVDMVRTFKGGERACAIVVGDHNPVADMEIIVYDSKDRIVVQDGGQKLGDVVGVVWHPQRTEQFRIVIRNPATKTRNNPHNHCWVAIK